MRNTHKHIIRRSFRLKNSGPETVHDIDGVRFEGNIDTFDNGFKFEENKCYQRGSTNILKSGVRDLSKLLKAPIFTSFPHFFGADEYFRNAVEGLKPISQKHNMRLVLQKVSVLSIRIGLE